MQMAEHKKLVDQRKRGAPGSKEAEVFHLQEAMEERNERNVRRKFRKGSVLFPLSLKNCGSKGLSDNIII